MARNLGAFLPSGCPLRLDGGVRNGLERISLTERRSRPPDALHARTHDGLSGGSSTWAQRALRTWWAAPCLCSWLRWAAWALRSLRPRSLRPAAAVWCRRERNPPREPAV